MPERATVGPGDAHAAPERARSPAATEATLAGRVRELQQSHGNAAVARMIEASRGGAVLAREPTDAGVPPVAGVPIAEPRPGDAADMDRAIGEYLWINDFSNAARILNGFNQADIDSRIKGYTVQQRNGFYDAADINGDAAVRIRAPIELVRAIDERDWAAAARVLNTYPEIATRVSGQLRGMDGGRRCTCWRRPMRPTWRWRDRCARSSPNVRAISPPVWARRRASTTGQAPPRCSTR